MRSRFMLGLAMAPMACGSGSPLGDEPVGTTASAIIDGMPDAADPAVVALTDANGLPSCTGMLVSPHLVLTARHCLSVSVLAYFGANPVEDGSFVPLMTSYPNPDADIGMVALARSVPIAPVSLNHHPMTQPIGASLRFVGFGYQSPIDAGPITAPTQADFGTKATGLGTLTSISPDSVTYTQATCHGDSGGPAFDSESGHDIVVGVTSQGDPTCSQYGVSVRVDAYAAWIDETIAAVDPPSCGLDWRCVAGCAVEDPDCTIEE